MKKVIELIYDLIEMSSKLYTLLFFFWILRDIIFTIIGLHFHFQLLEDFLSMIYHFLPNFLHIIFIRSFFFFFFWLCLNLPSFIFLSAPTKCGEKRKLNEQEDHPHKKAAKTGKLEGLFFDFFFFLWIYLKI